MLEKFLEDKKAESSFRTKVLGLNTETNGRLEILVSEFRPSLSQLRQIVKLVFEISKRDQLSPEGLLEIEKSLGLKSFIKSLESIRYPLRAKLEAKLDKLQKKAQKEHGVLLSYPRDLEGLKLDFKQTIRSEAELVGYIKNLEELSQSGLVSQIHALLSGKE